MLKRTVTTVVVVLAVLGAAGCSGDGTPSTPAGTPVSGVPGPPSPADVAPGDWPTYHHDNARAGVAPDFPPVGPLHTAWQARLDGAVYGQPLVIGTRVLAATEHDSVYSLDAASGRVQWSIHLGEPVPRSALPCGNIDPLGITGTMAYDAATRQVFAVAETAGGTHTLYGLDVATGAVRLRRVAEPPKGDKLAHQQRAALTVHDGRVYVAYGGLAGDCAEYIGSVVGVPTTGDAPIVSYAVPTTREAGIWSPGGAAVANGRLYYAVGNGESTSGTFDGSDSVLAMTPDLQRADLFAPAEWADDNVKDLDLGSLTPVLVGPYVLIAGKRGQGYVLRGDHLGGIGGQVTETTLCRAFGGAAVVGSTAYVPCADGMRAVTVSPDGSVTVGWRGPANARGSPVVGGGGVWIVDYDGGTLYVLDLASGAVRQQVGIGRAPHFASPTLAAGTAFVGTMTGVTAVKTG